jgi:hypothetical protein
MEGWREELPRDLGRTRSWSPSAPRLSRSGPNMQTRFDSVSRNSRRRSASPKTPPKRPRKFQQNQVVFGQLQTDMAAKTQKTRPCPSGSRPRTPDYGLRQNVTTERNQRPRPRLSCTLRERLMASGSSPSSLGRLTTCRKTRIGQLAPVTRVACRRRATCRGP